MDTDKLFDIAMASVIFAIAAGFLTGVAMLVYATLTGSGC